MGAIPADHEARSEVGLDGPQAGGPFQFAFYELRVKQVAFPVRPARIAGICLQE